MAPSSDERVTITDESRPDPQSDGSNAIEKSCAESNDHTEESQPCGSSSPAPHKGTEAEAEHSEENDSGEPGEATDDEKSEGEEEKPIDDGPADAGDTSAEAAGGNAAAPPPLPDEPLPEVQQDDGWDPMWSDEHKAWFFFNRFTKQTQWENPRVPTETAETIRGGAAAAAVAAAGVTSGGYNPAIHGDYDPTAWYATGLDPDAGTHGEDVGGLGGDAAITAAAAAASMILSGGGGADTDSTGESQFSHDAKARRQMNAYFDMNAAASAHDGRSLKAERSGKKPTRAELKAFKEKRRARKEEKRRAWLRD